MRAPLLLCLLLSSCAPTPTQSPLTDAQSRNRQTVTRYLAATSPDQAAACLAPSYRPRLLEWDTLLHAQRTTPLLVVNDDAAIAVIHEDNDFSRLIGHPGWDGTVTYTFDDQGRITRSAFTPMPGKNPPWRPYLDAALPWLREHRPAEHRPAELAAVFPDEHLKQDADSARTWSRILHDWRTATGR